MKCFITSCKRHDLLTTTLLSLPEKAFNQVVVHEDSWKGYVHTEALKWPSSNYNIKYFGGVGQAESIANFIDGCKDEYYFHCEDDWLFDADKPFLNDSLEVLNYDSSVVKVFSRGVNIHNVRKLDTGSGLDYYEMMPTDFYGNVWHGFGWNPGVTRVEPLKHIDLRVSERDVMLQIKELGLKCVYLDYTFYEHIGNGRSTRVDGY